MKILHVSDLHVTDEFKTLEQAWSGVDAILEQHRPFDFIVVSGDLSQRSDPSEYDRLLAFATTHFLPLLGKPDERQRVIFVPGNHDVDWSAKLGLAMDLAETSERDGPTAITKMLARYRADPGDIQLRLRLSDLGHVGLIAVDEKEYPKRFSNVQKFLNDFYGDCLKVPKNHHFDLLGSTNEDWSSHFFPDENVAFFGFNTCPQNDRYWHGASFHPPSVVRAGQLARSLDPQPLLIAVWHHGLLGGAQHRPDYLTPANVGLLYDAGFRIGFHGHTHRAAIDDGGITFETPFVMVATGSLGAGSKDRPGAVGNQFSICDVHPPQQMTVQVYARTGPADVYRPEPEQFFYIRPDTERRRRGRTTTRAKRHRRAYYIDGTTGITKVEVNLEKLRVAQRVVLAQVAPPICDARAAGPAWTADGPVEVERHEIEGGEIQFLLSPVPRDVQPDAAELLHFTNLDWKYHASNVLALSRFDLEMRDVSIDLVDSGREYRPHTVRFPCDELVMEVGLSNNDDIATLIDTTTVEKVVLDRHRPGPIQRDVRRVSSEEKRCKIVHENGRLIFRVAAPIVGFRYGPSYVLRASGTPMTRGQQRALDDLVLRCRVKNDELGLRLSEAVRHAVTDLLGGPFSSANWIGFLWSSEESRLLPCFGEFGRRAWGVRFPWGSGVAGHCIRFAQPAAWCQTAGSIPDTLIYQPRPEFQSWTENHEWVICLPLLLGPSGPVAGVISFQSEDTNCEAEHRLRELADARVWNEHGASNGHGRTVLDMMTALNQLFWDELANSTSIPIREMAIAARTSLGLAAEPPTL